MNILQEAHEREVTTYMSNIGPMREQLNVQQVSINNLQKQLATAKEELAIITVERDHLDSRIKNMTLMNCANGSEDETTQLSLQKKVRRAIQITRPVFYAFCKLYFEIE